MLVAVIAWKTKDRGMNGFIKRGDWSSYSQDAIDFHSVAHGDELEYYFSTKASVVVADGIAAFGTKTGSAAAVHDDLEL